MRPRFLRYLRVNDEPPNVNDDLTLELPVEVDDLGKWFEFCQDLSRQRLWDYELLTLDFNFKEDKSGPWFPLFGLDPKVCNKDFLGDPNLRLLRWPDSLVTDQIGPNSGLLIGAYLVSFSAHRDLPCGVAFHTRHTDMVMNDMPSAMLATQILLSSGADLPTRDLRETMSKAIDLVAQSFRQPALGLGTAAARFRQAFLHRAGAGGLSDEGEVRLWAEPSSLWKLLNVFRAAQTEEELDAALDKYGVEFYDRNGALHSLHVRSMFLDRLIYRTPEDVANVRSRLPLADAKPAGDGQEEPGALWQFVEALAARTPSNIAPVLEYFRATEGDREPRSINESVKRKIHRLLALVFAWLDLYAEGWFAEQSQSYDPFERDFGGDFPTLTQQVAALLKIYERTRDNGWLAADGADFDPKLHPVRLSDKEGRSLSEAVREHAGIPGSPLYKPLRYDRPETDRLSQKRHDALEHLLTTAARWRCVEREADAEGRPTGRYRLRRADVPEQRPSKPSQADIAQRLGFNVQPGQDASKQLGRIIHDTPGYEGVTVKDFLGSLEEKPLPNHLKWLGWEFLEEFWGPRSDLTLDYDAWPVCLAEVGPESGDPVSLAEWRRKERRTLQAASEVQSLIMPSPVHHREGRVEIWCWRHFAEDVGGDYYRVKKTPDGGYRLYVGDACGHGPPAALLIQEIHGLLTVLEEQAPPPEKLCAQLDARLYERAFGSGQAEAAGHWALCTQWASLFCVALDPSSGRLTYANAGHPPPLLVRRDGAAAALGHGPDSRSRALGQVPGSQYSSETVELAPGDRVVLFTDGVGEALGDGLLACVREKRGLRARELGEEIVRRLSHARGPNDDRTLVVLSVE